MEKTGMGRNRDTAAERFLVLLALAVPLTACYYVRIHVSSVGMGTFLALAGIWYLCSAICASRSDGRLLTAMICAAVPFGMLFTAAQLPHGAQTAVFVSVMILATVCCRSVQSIETGVRYRSGNGRLLNAVHHFRACSRLAGGVLAAVAFLTAIPPMMPHGGLGKLRDPDGLPGGTQITQDAAEMIERYRDELVIIDRWAELSLGEREELMQLYCDIECSYYGVFFPVDVELIDIWSLIQGRYDRRHTILLNTLFADQDSGYEMLSTLFHEVAHVYQKCLVDASDALPEKYRDLIAVRRAATFREELKNYITTDVDLFGYYYQQLEIDARALSA